MTTYFRFISNCIACSILIYIGFIAGCSTAKSRASIRFDRSEIDKENPIQRAVADIDNDGFLDLFGAVDFESGKKIGLFWYSYPTWKRYTISLGLNFRGDDFECGDIDGDGDPDPVVTTDEDGNVFWYENPLPSGDPRSSDWIAHKIGTSGSYVKDVEVNDLDADGHLDIIVRGEDILTIFKQSATGTWSKVSKKIHNKEGMSVGDIDKDGDLDVVLNGFWLETPKNLLQDTWNEHVIDRKWFEQATGQWQDNCANVVVVDIDQDGRMDVLLSHSEKTDWPIVWYSSSNPKKGPWVEHIVSKSFNYCETLQAKDMNSDGTIDVVAGEMKKSSKFGDLKIFFQDRSKAQWREEVIASRIGIYDGLVADIGNDGDYDIIGPQDYNKAPTNYWENKTNDEQYWRYQSIDDSRPKSEFGKMGLVFTDINSDGWKDIVAGSFIYLNPKGHLTNKWQRIGLPKNVDVYFALNVDDDDFSDLIAISDNKIYWLESDESRKNWSSCPVGDVPQGRTQGYVMAQIIPGGKPELVFTRAHYLYYLVVPPAKVAGKPWRMVEVSNSNEEEGVAVGDFDRDGDVDLAAVAQDGHHVIWLENPGNGSSNWQQYSIGLSDQWLDRIAVADVNEDGRLDIVATQETRDWKFNSNIYWYEAPKKPKVSSTWKKVTNRLPFLERVVPYWSRHTIGTLRSVNSMDVGDINNDGEIDIVAAEHTDQTSSKGASDNLTIAYLNSKKGGKWRSHLVERGPHSSHLGARLVDLDNDGDLDIVSIAWHQYRNIHLWIDQTLPRN